MWRCLRCLVFLSWWCSIVSTCGRWSALVACPLLSCRVPSLLSALSLCACRVACEYASISRFRGVFSVVYRFRVGLYGLGALRGLWGFCVREWLGGLKACGVFALLFILFAFRFIFLPCFWGFAFVVLCLSSCFLVGLCILFFPCGLYAKKKGRKVFPLASSLVLLWVFRFRQSPK